MKVSKKTKAKAKANPKKEIDFDVIRKELKALIKELSKEIK